MHAAPLTRPIPARASAARPAAYALAATGALAATAAAAALGAEAGTGHPTTTAFLRAATAGVPLAAGLYGCYARQFAAFSRLLIAVGVLAALAALAESGDPMAYTAGRLAAYALELALVVALLSFPHGLPREGTDRRLIGAMAVAAGAFSLSAIVSPTFRLPSPYTSCREDCPESVLHAVTLPEGAVAALVAFGGALLFGVLMLVVVRLQRRVLEAPEPLAGVLRPVLFAGLLLTTLVGWAIAARTFDPTSPLTATATELVAWATPLLGLAFLMGSLEQRLGDERTLTRLTRRVGAAACPTHVQGAYEDAFGARGVRLLLPGEQPAVRSPPAPASARGARVLRAGDGAALGTLSYDATLDQRPELLDAAAVLGTVALENLRLARAAGVAATEIADSRLRIAASAERERRRIERDLHDGAQQRLVALRIELGLVEDMIARGHSASGIERLHELEESVEAALEELRTLAHGVCPPLLADRGLPEALKAAAARCPVPARVTASGIGRYPSEIESAVYFCVLEALQNAAKHARGARRVLVTLRDDRRGRLQFSVRDDGAGARAGHGEGNGLANMRDRVEAVGGELRITMTRGAGAEVRGSIPVG